MKTLRCIDSTTEQIAKGPVGANIRFEYSGFAFLIQSGRNAGVSIIELMVMVGIMSIISMGIASMYNFGFDSLKHMRFGTDVQSIEQLLEVTLSRPRSPLEEQTKKRVCAIALQKLQGYTGTKQTKLDGIYDSSNKSILNSFNDSEYKLSAYVDVATSGPIAFKGFDEDSNTLADFNYFLTQVVVLGTKTTQGNLGADTMSGRVGVSLITRANGTVYDCMVNTVDEKRVCELLGGQLAKNPLTVPRCVFNRLPVALDWSLIPPTTPPNELFKLGETYAQKGVFAGDTATLSAKFGGGKRGTAGGFAVGAPSKDLLVAGEDASGAFGFANYFDNNGFWALFPETASSPLYPNGYMALRTYGDVPFVFSNGNPKLPLSGASTDTAVISPRRNLFVFNGTMASTNQTQAMPYFNGGATSGLREKTGLAAIYSDKLSISLGGSNDGAYGTFIVEPTRRLAGFFYGSTYSGNPQGAMAMKAYNGNDLIFMTTNALPCSGCNPLFIKGTTGNTTIGSDFTTSPAKLWVRADKGLLTNPALKLLGTSTFGGNVNITSSVLTTFDGFMTVNGTVYNANSARIVIGESDERLKTDIKPIPNALEKILQVHGVYYRWKNKQLGDRQQIGLIAQDVEKAFPELVANTPSGTKAVAYQNMVAPLIEAMKSQQKEIEQLKLDRKILSEDLDAVLLRLCQSDPADSLCREED